MEVRIQRWEIMRLRYSLSDTQVAFLKVLWWFSSRNLGEDEAGHHFQDVDRSSSSTGSYPVCLQMQVFEECRGTYTECLQFAETGVSVILSKSKNVYMIRQFTWWPQEKPWTYWAKISAEVPLVSCYAKGALLNAGSHCWWEKTFLCCRVICYC